MKRSLYWILTILAWASPVLLAMLAFWLHEHVEASYWERKSLEEVELDIRPRGLTDNWFYCNHADKLNTVGLYLNCINGIQARVDF